MQRCGALPSGRNMRNAWQITTKPFAGSHFATFPPELPMRCIRAGTSEKGVCSKCGAPWVRTFEKVAGANERNEVVPDYDVPGLSKGSSADRVRRLSGRNYIYAVKAVGWEPTCTHDADAVPATVLDPFCGSGTTLYAARKLGRKSIGIDIDERSAELLAERLGNQGVLL